LRPPQDATDEALVLRDAAVALLGRLSRLEARASRQAARIARTMGSAGWLWSDAVLANLAEDPGRGHGLDAWTHLPRWNEAARPVGGPQSGVTPQAARARLAACLPANAEPREAQADYAAGVTSAFQARDPAGLAQVVLAEAGTGVGKTLGYLAPASLWAEANGEPVWISTFTKNLQHQIDGELDRLYPDADDKRAHVAVRKGRENYLCLLNLEEAVGRRTLPGEGIALGLVARWIAATRDGDMQGGDLPAWLGQLVGRARLARLADRRGECIGSACAHYRKCFTERAIRRARSATIVIANHALLMSHAAAATDVAPGRVVFDEGHHLFSAADGAFSTHLTGVEAAHLRRWIRGASARGRRAPGGLAQRYGDLVDGVPAAEAALREIVAAARILPREGWLERIEDPNVAGDLAGGVRLGLTEAFLAQAASHVRSRSNDRRAYGLEAEATDCGPELLSAAAELKAGLQEILAPVDALIAAWATYLEDPELDLDPTTVGRIEAARASLMRRGAAALVAWISMLDDLPAGPPDHFVDWFAVERFGGRVRDTGLHRHWIDPTKPFAETLIGATDGAVITSATLRDGAVESAATWSAAEVRTGAQHLALPAARIGLASPFDYAAQTRIFIVTDVGRDADAEVAAAVRDLFLAARGGGLGLFTSIARLRAVHGCIAQDLADAGLTLLAQHVDGLDAGTLVDIFRADRESCLLGTDAVRDGVDVPGRALRLIVFDRVPWPRPDILHRARREHFGAGYDDILTRLRLKQAYGRLIRRADDHGVFIMLDSRLPTRLCSAFPEDVAIERLPLAEVIGQTGHFLSGFPRT
jgi:ATP-dependent DNA helicase DinG